ncbi:MAG: DUF2079 domain-containing protein [Nitrospirae bacterium]|nr:DUF2079 domain-containing protein [Nitrospirota bacterium]
MISHFRKKINLAVVVPLFLLVFLFATDFVGEHMAGDAIHRDIAVHRYFSIPLVGFSLGLMVFVGVLKKGWRLPSALADFLSRKSLGIVIASSAVFTIFFSAVLILRYTSFHTSVYELGGYDNKIWRISEELSLGKSLIVAATGHFQPILILHGLLYKINNSPVVILIVQVLTVVSGVIPLYLLAKDILKESVWTLMIILLYLLYPPVEFNSIADFHPDHFYIPLSLWAFYFAVRKNYLISVLMIGLGALSKEPLLLGASFWGLYLIFNAKRYWLGSFSFIVFILIFFVVVLYIQPHLDPGLKKHNINILQTESFSYMTDAVNYPNAIFSGIFKGLMRKLLFLFFILTPFLFLPLLGCKEFLPAIPLLAIPFLSSNPAHSNIESQYTAGIIAPVFVAFLVVLEKIKNKSGTRYAAAILSFVTVMVVTFHIAKSPSPFSINFWSQQWSDTWNYSNYISGEHEKAIRNVVCRIPDDRNKVVVTQSNINNKLLSHRFEYRGFPYEWEDADYILLDMKRPLMVADRIDEKAYMDELKKLRNNPGFQMDFMQDGVMVFKKIGKAKTT